MVERNHEELLELLKRQIEARTRLQQEQHTAFHELQDQQYQEAQAFLQANADKLLEGSESRFRQLIDDNRQQEADKMRRRHQEERDLLAANNDSELQSLEQQQQQQKRDLLARCDEEKKSHGLLLSKRARVTDSMSASS